MTNQENNVCLIGFCAGMILVSIIALIGLSVKINEINLNWQRDVVIRGYGQFIMTTNIPPKVEFQWKDYEKSLTIERK